MPYVDRQFPERYYCPQKAQPGPVQPPTPPDPHPRPGPQPYHSLPHNQRRRPRKRTKTAVYLILFLFALILIAYVFLLADEPDKTSTDEQPISSVQPGAPMVSPQTPGVRRPDTPQITVTITTLPIKVKPVINTQRLERMIHDIVNQERNKAGLDSLALDDCITRVARMHSADMANQHYFSHINPLGEDQTARGARLGCYCHKVVGIYYYIGLSENIFQNTLYDRYWSTNGIITRYEWNSEEEIAQSTVQGWMNSPLHRENILTARYDREGIGVVISDDDKVYITQDFC